MKFSRNFFPSIHVGCRTNAKHLQYRQKQCKAPTDKTFCYLRVKANPTVHSTSISHGQQNWAWKFNFIILSFLLLYDAKTIGHIINVGRTLILGLPRNQNRCPIGYITLLSIISLLKLGVQCLWSLIYNLLPTPILVGPTRYETGEWQKCKMFLFL